MAIVTQIPILFFFRPRNLALTDLLALKLNALQQQQTMAHIAEHSSDMSTIDFAFLIDETSFSFFKIDCLLNEC
jgi:hypothetical protein